MVPDFTALVGKAVSGSHLFQSSSSVSGNNSGRIWQMLLRRGVCVLADHIGPCGMDPSRSVENRAPITSPQEPRFFPSARLHGFPPRLGHVKRFSAVSSHPLAHDFDPTRPHPCGRQRPRPPAGFVLLHHFLSQFSCVRPSERFRHRPASVSKSAPRHKRVQIRNKNDFSIKHTHTLFIQFSSPLFCLFFSLLFVFVLDVCFLIFSFLL